MIETRFMRDTAEVNIVIVIVILNVVIVILNIIVNIVIFIINVVIIS